MFKIHNLSKIVIISVCIISHVFAMTDAQKIENALGIITLQNMKDVPVHEFSDAWSNLEQLINSGLAQDEATKVMTTIIDSCKKYDWECSPADVSMINRWYSQRNLFRLVTCCVKKGFYQKEAIELLQQPNVRIVSGEADDLIKSLFDAEYGLPELEQIAQKSFETCTLDSVISALQIYECFAEKNLLTPKAFSAVIETCRHCDDEIFETYNSRYITEPALKVLTALVKNGHFVDEGFELARCFLAYPFELPNEIQNLLVRLAHYDVYMPKIFQLAQQSLVSENVEASKCLLSAILFLVMIDGLHFEQAYEVAAQALQRSDESVRKNAIMIFLALVYYDKYINEATAVMHSAEKDESEIIRDGACELRCFLAARGKEVEETRALAQKKETDLDVALEFYHALVKSGHYLDEALEKIQQVVQMEDAQDYSVLPLLLSLFMRGHRVTEVNQCALMFMKKLDDNCYYTDEISVLDMRKIYRLNGTPLDSDSACKVFFNALFTSSDVAHAKDSCQKALIEKGIDPTMFIDVFFE